jgi:SAM-dependent methyltransferase
VSYLKLVTHYESCFQKHGVSARGLDWPNPEDLETRFWVLTESFQQLKKPLRLLDLGCGPGLYYEFLKNHNFLGDQLSYTGIDLAPEMIASAKARYPEADFRVHDIIRNPLPENSFDFAVLNGVLTIKNDLSYLEMRKFAEQILQCVFAICAEGIIFNAMSTYVEWCRLDLFHWDFDDLIPFIRSKLSPHFAYRMDYGLYEFMMSAYKKPQLGV